MVALQKIVEVKANQNSNSVNMNAASLFSSPQTNTTINTIVANAFTGIPPSFDFSPKLANFNEFWSNMKNSLTGAESYCGQINTMEDALLLVEACRQGLLPKVTSRMGDRARSLIRNGSVFLFNEKESGIKRWTDGKIWSPSRIAGEFLVYKELERRHSEEESQLIKLNGFIKRTVSIRLVKEYYHIVCYSGGNEEHSKTKLCAPSRCSYFLQLAKGQELNRFVGTLVDRSNISKKKPPTLSNHFHSCDIPIKPRPMVTRPRFGERRIVNNAFMRESDKMKISSLITPITRSEMFPHNFLYNYY